MEDELREVYELQDIYEYKSALEPQQFFPEWWGWEIVDIGVLLLLMTLAVWGSKRQKPFWQFASFFTVSFFALASFLYFGIFRGGCICPVGAISNVTIGIFSPEFISKTTAIIFLLPLVFAFFFGRVFCSSACPLGACQELVMRLQPLRLPRRVCRVLLWLAPLVLLLAIFAALTSQTFLVCQLDPFKVLFFTGKLWVMQLELLMRGNYFFSDFAPTIPVVGSLTAWGILLSVLLVSHFIARPFCRWICPYSVLLGALSVVGFGQREIAQENCRNCQRCRNLCPMQAIDANLRISRYECLECDRCHNACKHQAIVR